MALDEAGSVNLRPNSTNRRIESFNVPDLQDTSTPVSEIDKFGRLGERDGDRLFHQDMYACIEAEFRDRMMGQRRNGNAHGIDMREECGDLRIEANPVLVRDCLPPFRIAICDPDQRRSRQCSVETRMVLTQMADPYDADS